MKSIQKASFIFLLLFLSSSLLQAQKSFKYSSEEGKLSLKFPAEYTETESENEISKDLKIQCNKDSISYFASYSLHKTEMDEDPIEMAEASLESFVDGVKGVEITRVAWNVKKHEGLKAKIEIPANESIVDYRVILVGNTQYQLLVVTPKDECDNKNVRSFFKSFKLKK